MKNLLSLAALILAFGQSQVFAQNTETRAVESFSKINLSGGPDQVILRAGETESVTFEGAAADLAKIKTWVERGDLNVEQKNGTNLSGKVKMVVTFKTLETINSSGSTDFVAESPIRGEKFEFNASGSGDFKGELDVKKLSIAISGSSDLSLSGRADDQNIAISGSGDVDAAKCHGKQAEVAISGSGDVKLNVEGHVKSAVSGSGDITNVH